MEIGRISINDLSREAALFINTLNSNRKSDRSMPLYLKDADRVFFIEDAPVPMGADLAFTEEAAKHNLYRGGGTVLVRCRHGKIVVFDDRYHYWKGFGGVADFSEATSLLKTAQRELMEEVFIVTPITNQPKRFVPKGLKGEDSIFIKELNYTAKVVELETGLDIRGYYLNPNDQFLTLVAEWFIDTDKPFTAIISEDEWPFIGRPNITPVVIDHNGEFVGYFSGQQGFVPTTKNKKPRLHKYLKL